MSDISTVSLLNQMRTMAVQASGMNVDTVANQQPFSQVFQQALSQVNDLNTASDSLKARFEMGDPNVSLADAMVAGQKANLGFEATLRVRNKITQAYQEIMSMPV